jgi:hypothetical protein
MIIKMGITSMKQFKEKTKRITHKIALKQEI